MKIFQKRQFRILCYTTAISSLGDSLYSLACTLTVYAMTGSLFGVAGMWLIRALIRIPSQFISGIVTDRCNRKRISIAVYFLSAVLVSLFILINESNLALAFVLIFILQGTSDMDNMAQMAILPELLAKEELQSANGIFHIIGTVVMLVGPGVGGLLYKLYGSNLLYLIDAATFLVSALLMLLIKYQKPQTEAKKVKFTLFSFAREGFQEIRKHSVIKVMVLTTVFFGILGRFYEIDKIYMADKILNIGAEGIVFFSYAMSIGSLLAPFVLKIFEKKEIPAVKTYAYLSVFTVVSFVLWGISTNLYICLFANLILGIFNTGNAIYVNVVFQKEVDSQYLGRVMSFYKICIVCSAVIGALCAPILVKILGVGGSMLGVGAIALIGIAVIFIQKICSK